jgi:hypothetical protein
MGSVETVTLLVTDLVGSTGLESRIGRAAAEELRGEHFGLLRDAIAEAGGRELKNTGDGWTAAFGSAAAAVSCAVSVQQRFERRNRSAGEQLLIKVGVSSGDASAVDGDYFGMPVRELVKPRSSTPKIQSAHTGSRSACRPVACWSARRRRRGSGALSGLSPSLRLGCGTFGGNSTTDNVDYTHVRNVKRQASIHYGNLLEYNRLAKKL